MSEILNNIIKRASELQKNIVLPEGEDSRVVEAAAQATCVEGAKKKLHINVTPFQANDTISFTSGTEAKATVEKVDNRTVTVTPQASGTAGSATITASAESGAVTATISVTVNAAA